VIGENKGCFSVRSENRVRRTCILNVDAFMDIEGQLRQAALQYRPSKIATEIGDIGIFSMRDIWAVGSLAARTQRSTITGAIAFISLILIPSLGSAAIYKCTAQDGGITYTDEPCPADTTSQYIDPATPTWLNESPQTMNTTPALPDATSQSQPEILAILCANDEFKVWLKAQRHSLPERDVRTAKLIRFNNLCRRALHLPVVAATIPQTT
jgi:hypothetical protein